MNPHRQGQAELQTTRFSSSAGMNWAEWALPFPVAVAGGAEALTQIECSW